MKYFITIAVVAALCTLAQVNTVTAQADSETCVVGVKSACVDNGSADDVKNCNAILSPNDHLGNHMQNFVLSQLAKSYEYLLMATHFNSYQMNRPGFQKLYQGLSDRSFDDTIALIKQVTRRGGSINLAKERKAERRPTLQLNELGSLAHALDTEKKLTREAIEVHTSATHSTTQNKVHDPEMAHYLQENFLTKQVESVRKLSGYANDLSKLVKVGQPSLNVYLFDEYLLKQ